MKIGSIYNTKVTLEEGDLIALEEKRLLIMVEDKLYVSVGKVDINNLESEIYVHSAGFYSRTKDILPKNLEWIKYNPSNSKK